MNEQTKGMILPYIENVRKAGKEYKETGRITDETQEALDRLIVPAEAFIQTTNEFFACIRNQG